MTNIQSINPVTEEIIKQYNVFSDKKVQTMLEASKEAYHHWRQTDITFRANLFLKMADRLEKDATILGKLITQEMGKALSQAESEVKKCALTCRYYAEHGEALLADVPVETEFYKSYKTYQPVGTILAIMPWNFPFWQVFRCAIPAMMAGNTVILRHAHNVNGCAFQIEKLFQEIGFLKDTFQTVVVEHDQIPSIIAHSAVQGVSLTGSTYAGSQVAKVAGEALKKTVLELGGSDPYLILEDANLALAATACVTSRLNNAGQSCIAAKRFIVLDKVYDDFVEKVLAQLKVAKMGDPMAEETTLGPMATTALRDKLHEQVKASIDKGAKCLLGGEIPAGKGAYYPPTLLTEVSPGMPAYEEELFGPVASIIRAQSEVEAIQIANDSVYGLGGGVFTQDLERGEQIAKYEIQTGGCTVNGFVASDPRLPFGGVKQSGYGRELSSDGLHEFTNIKTIIVKK